jgi:hypothetical protein
LGTACCDTIQSPYLKELNIKIHKLYRTVALCVCGISSLTLREGHWRMFEKRVQTRIFGPEIEKVTGKWRKLHNFLIFTHQFILRY